MNTNRLFVLIFLIGAITPRAEAQNFITDFLSRPMLDAEIIGINKQIEYFNNNSFNSPVLRDIELRIRSNDFNPSLEDYRLRFELLNPGEQKANKVLNATQGQYLKVQYLNEVNDLLSIRYKQLIQHYFISKSKDLYAKQIEQVRSKFSENSTNGTEVKNLISIDKSILKLELKIEEVNATQNRLEYVMNGFSIINEAIKWDNFKIITVNQIKENLFGIDSLNQSSKLEKANLEYLIEEQTFRLELAESRSNIGFLQTEYDIERGNELEEHLGFQVGLSIPIFNSNRPKLQRNKLELIESEYQLLKTKQEENTDRFNNSIQLKELFNSYYKVGLKSENIRKMKSNMILDDLSSYISIEEYLTELQEIEYELEYRILLLYIEILTQRGDLSIIPYINYLSTGLETFSFN